MAPDRMAEKNGRVRFFKILCKEGAALNLAHRAFGNIIEEQDFRGNLVIREAPCDKVGQLVSSESPARPSADEGYHALAPDDIRSPDNANIANGTVLANRGLDLLGRDVQSSADNDFLFAPFPQP
jgi:hypothetical protein